MDNEDDVRVPAVAADEAPAAMASLLLKSRGGHAAGNGTQSNGKADKAIATNNNRFALMAIDDDDDEAEDEDDEVQVQAGRQPQVKAKKEEEEEEDTRESSGTAETASTSEKKKRKKRKKRSKGSTGTQEEPEAPAATPQSKPAGASKPRKTTGTASAVLASLLHPAELYG